jgi:hypothetical protein
VGVDTHLQSARILGAEAFLHGGGPDAPDRPDLAGLLEEVVGLGELEAEALQRDVGVETRLDAGPHQFDAVGQHDGDLMDSGAAGLLDAIAQQVGGVPARHVLGAIMNQLR